MRFIRRQKLITTVSDQEMTSMEDVKVLLESLCRSDVYIQFVYNDVRSEAMISYNNVRVKRVEDGKVDISVYRKTGSMALSGIPFESISLIKMVTGSSNILVDEQELTRFDLLDIETGRAKSDD